MTELPPRGRPPVMDQAERCRLILAAAATVFTEHGYVATSMDDVAKACGMSRKTIYGLFSSKLDLFAGLVLRSVPAPEAPDAFVGATFEESVNHVMDRVCASALAPQVLAMLRLVIAEARATPELAATYYEKTVEHGRAFLAAELKRLGEKFDHPVGDVDQLSDILFGAAVAGPLIHGLVGDIKTHTAEETRRRTRRIVAALVRNPMDS